MFSFVFNSLRSDYRLFCGSVASGTTGCCGWNIVQSGVRDPAAGRLVVSHWLCPLANPAGNVVLCRNQPVLSRLAWVNEVWDWCVCVWVVKVLVGIPAHTVFPHSFTHHLFWWLWTRRLLDFNPVWIKHVCFSRTTMVIIFFYLGQSIPIYIGMSMIVLLFFYPKLIYFNLSWILNCGFYVDYM